MGALSGVPHFFGSTFDPLVAFLSKVRKCTLFNFNELQEIGQFAHYLALGVDEARRGMGRRAVHTSEELRELILEAATGIVATYGYGALSARVIAKQIDYSPGTIYNVFENLDDLVLTIEGRLLDRLIERLDTVTSAGAPCEQICLFAESYLAFSCENRRLWTLLVEHQLPAGQEVPVWYQQKVEHLVQRLEALLLSLEGAASQPDSARRCARVIWACVHGIASLAAAEKLSGFADGAAGQLVQDLVRTYMDGLAWRRDRSATV